MTNLNRLTDQTRSSLASVLLLLTLAAVFALILPDELQRPANEGISVPIGAFARLGRGYIWSADMTSNREYLAIGTTTGLDVYRNSGSGFQHMWSATGNEVEAVRFSPDGTRIASRQYDKVIVHDLSGNVTTTLIGFIQGSYATLAWSPNGEMLAVGSWFGPPETGILSIWDVSTTARLKLISYPFHGMNVIATWSPDNQRIAIASGEGIAIYDVHVSEQTRTYLGDNWAADSLLWSPDGSKLAAGFSTNLYTNEASKITFWDIHTGANLKTIQGPDHGVIDHLIWSPDGTDVIAAFRGGHLMRWNISTGAMLNEADMGQNIVAIGWPSVKEEPIAVLADGSVSVWQSESIKRTVVPGYTDILNSLTWSPDGTRIATGGSHGIITLWNVETHLKLCEMQDPETWNTTVAWSPNVQWLVASGYSSTYLWNIDNCTLEKTFIKAGPIEGLVGNRKMAETGDIAFSPDGRYVAIGYSNGSVKVLDTVAGQVLRTFEKHDREVTSVAWSPDGKRVASSSIDGTVIIWQVLP